MRRGGARGDDAEGGVSEASERRARARRERRGAKPPATERARRECGEASHDAGRAFLAAPCDLPRVPRDWDGATYHRISAPQFAWGQAVLATVELAGDERVLDVGCGTGRLTAILLERLPRGSVVALDRTPSMVAKARAHLAAHGERVEVRAARRARAR